MKTMVIGCGPAGHNAAVNLKKTDSTIDVVVVDRQEAPYYSKIRLPQYVAGKVDEDGITMFRRGDYESLGVETRFDAEVTALDTDGKTVTLKNGERMSWDKLVLATGAEAAKPPIPGVDADERIVSLRGLDDARRLIERLLVARRALVVGGGTLGLELSMVFKRKGKDVELVELLPRLLADLLAEEESETLRLNLVGEGVDIALGTRVESFESVDDGVVAALSNGRRLTVELVVICAGIKPRIALAKAAGLETRRGIVVDHRLETSRTDVHAIGDCAEIEGRVAGLWSAATAQGKALAKILLGQEEKYEEAGHRPVVRIPGIDFSPNPKKN